MILYMYTQIIIIARITHISVLNIFYKVQALWIGFLLLFAKNKNTPVLNIWDFFFL